MSRDVVILAGARSAIGMSGTRILLNPVHQLGAPGGSRGFAAIRGNGGHGASLAVERAA